MFPAIPNAITTVTEYLLASSSIFPIVLFMKFESRLLLLKYNARSNRQLVYEVLLKSKTDVKYKVARNINEFKPVIFH